ncbi:MAG: ParB/RepB/Spo0J family partition protein [Betaproteobacteria bacterium]|nr:ParB/RepB/Spo0J family partition protein [Betaproteobacteria bacterium]
MAKMRGLGRGLDALLGGENERASAEELRNLAVESLLPGKYQPRTRMDQGALAELADSIKAQGVMQPILVRPMSDGRYEIIAGERRWRAARLAGLGAVPALVREVPDRQAVAVSLIENIQREDLNPLEEASGVQRLIDEFGMTHAEAAAALGRSRSGVTNLLRLLELAPPVRELLADGRLSMGHARALLTLPVARQIELAREAAQKQLSVREVERRASISAKPTAPTRRARVDRDVLRLEEELSNHLGTMVQIRSSAKPGRGRVIISYRSLDQLDTLLARLARGN